jgi:hypothetical protein
MTGPETPTRGCMRLAAPDRHGPNGPVPLALCPLGPHRPASTIHVHPPVRVTEPII